MKRIVKTNDNNYKPDYVLELNFNGRNQGIRSDKEANPDNRTQL